MLLVEQNAAMALDLADRRLPDRDRRVVLAGAADELKRRDGVRRASSDTDDDALLHQVLAGLATGGIYASLGLALVMIYQRHLLVNFAQGEMGCSLPTSPGADQRRHAVLAGFLLTLESLLY